MNRTWSRRRARFRRLVTAALILIPLLAVGVVVGAAAGEVDAMVYDKDIALSTPGPLGAVTVFGDSVLLGSGLVSPTLPDQLQAMGWGPIVFRAGVGNRAGPPGNASTAGWWLQNWRAHGWDAPNVIINLGANDSGVCRTDVACARRKILDVVDVIGAGHRIWWPMITRHPVYGPEAAAWNTALTQIAAERDDFFTWDWPAEMASGGYASNDFIHLDAAGYRRRSMRMATAFTNDLARAARVGGDAELPVPTAAPSGYVPLEPERVIDTRRDAPGRRSGGSELAVDFTGIVPSGATAVAISVTAAGPSADGYLAAGACGRPNTGSTVNFTRSTDRGAMTVTPLGPGGRVCVFASVDSDIIVDLQGAFVEASGAVGFNPTAVNRRLVDTRATGRSRTIVVDTPPGATAVAVNLTVVNAAAPGWLRAAPCDAIGDVSNVNYGGVEAVAGSAYVTTSAANTICVDTSTSADVIVDLTGTFGVGGLHFVPVPPSRMLDTRNAIGGWSPIQGAEQTLDVRVAPPDAKAVTGTLTIVDPASAGFLVAHACGARPPTSSVNADAGRVLANSITTGVSDLGRLCVFTHSVTHSLFDVTGWWFRERRNRDAATLATGDRAHRFSDGGLVRAVVADRCECRAAAPRERRVTLFADSVGLGVSNTYTGALKRAFPDDWETNVVGKPAVMLDTLLPNYIIPNLWALGDHVVIGAGYNYPYWDPDGFDRQIDAIVDTLTRAGVKHVYWVTLREVKPQYVSASAWRQMLPYSWYFPTVNQHFERAVERHPNLTLVDWAAAADQTGITYDAIHLNPVGAALYSSLIANAVHNTETPARQRAVTRVHVADDASTTAVAVNLTSTATRATGYFTAYPCDGVRPDVSNLNHRRDHTVAAASIIPVGPSGDICVYNRTTSQLIVDVFGRFDSTVDLVDTAPVRLFDSPSLRTRRTAGSELRIRVADPGVGAVALNVTALEPDSPGFVTVQACGLNTLDTSNVNVAPGRVTPNLVMARPDADGYVCIIASTTTHLIVDRFASFAADAPIDLVAPRRVTDTRSDGSTRSPGRIVRFAVGDDTGLDTGAAITGVFMNLTIADAGAAGYATAYPCAGGRPNTSNINFAPGQTIANFAVVQPDANGEICVYSDAAADILIDVMGSAGEGFRGITPIRKVDTRSGIGVP